MIFIFFFFIWPSPYKNFFNVYCVRIPSSKISAHCHPVKLNGNCF